MSFVFGFDFHIICTQSMQKVKILDMFKLGIYTVFSTLDNRVLIMYNTNVHE